MYGSGSESLIEKSLIGKRKKKRCLIEKGRVTAPVWELGVVDALRWGDGLRSGLERTLVTKEAWKLQQRWE